MKVFKQKVFNAFPDIIMPSKIYRFPLTIVPSRGGYFPIKKQ
jgi:hypothetical protein